MSLRSLVDMIRVTTATATVVLLSVTSTAVSFAASPSPGTVPPVDPRGGGEPPGLVVDLSRSSCSSFCSASLQLLPPSSWSD